MLRAVRVFEFPDFSRVYACAEHAEEGLRAPGTVRMSRWQEALHRLRGWLIYGTARQRGRR